MSLPPQLVWHGYHSSSLVLFERVGRPIRTRLFHTDAGHRSYHKGHYGEMRICLVPARMPDTRRVIEWRETNEKGT